MLKEMANLPGADVRDLRLIAKSLEQLGKRYPDSLRDTAQIPLLAICSLLRRAWRNARDARTANWYLFRLRVLYVDTTRLVQDAAMQTQKPTPPEIVFTFEEAMRIEQEKAGQREIPSNVPSTFGQVNRFIERSAPPPVTQLEAAVFWFGENLRRALFCPNPGCSAPYFFSQRKGQKFCRPECATPSRLESQRRWWNENRGKGGKGA